MVDQGKLDGILLEACREGRTERVQELLDAGANVHVWDDAALRWASERCHTATVKVLLKAGADVHAQDDDALLGAIYYGHTETARALLKGGADVHARDDAALRLAREIGHKDIVKLLEAWMESDSLRQAFAKAGIKLTPEQAAEAREIVLNHASKRKGGNPEAAPA